jgi:Ca2+-binding RTX toxin-like protein
MAIRFAQRKRIHVPNPVATRVRYEPLEGRVLFAATAAVVNGLLTVTGTDVRDVITLSAGAAPGRVEAKINGAAQSFNGVARISVSGGLGNDELTVGADLALPATLSGDAGGDVLFGGAGDDLLDGGTGNDMFYPGDGNDIVNGGRGADFINSDAGADLVSGGDGDDFFSYYFRTADLSISLDGVANDGEAGEHDNFGADVERFNGGSGHDVFIGSPADNAFYGGAGADRVFGLGGNDFVEATEGSLLDGGDGNDRLKTFGVNVPSTLVGGNGDDRLEGSSIDVYDPGPGLDAINGLREDGVPVDPSGPPVTLIESSHTLMLWTIAGGAPGGDSVRVANVPASSPARIRVTVRIAGETADHVVDVPVADVKQLLVTTYEGDDRVDLTGVTIPATVEGGPGNDTILGGDANDVLRGQAGDDVVRGAGGDDTLEDAAGNNTLDGGPGRDTVNGVREPVSGDVLYEAERGTGSGVRATATNAGFTGTGYMDYGSSPGHYFDLPVAAAAAGPHLLTVRYANGNASSRPLQLSVNGQPLGVPVPFPGTGSWST